MFQVKEKGVVVTGYGYVNILSVLDKNMLLKNEVLLSITSQNNLILNPNLTVLSKKKMKQYN